MKSNINISQICTNHGQIDGVPGNLRRVSVAGLTRMCDSIREDPDFLDIRPIAVFKHKGKYVCLGGNTRLKAARRLGLKDVPCVVIPEDTPIEKLKRFVIKDNGHYGEWDTEVLLADWDEEQLKDWGADFSTEKERKGHGPGWKSNSSNTTEHRTTLELYPTIHRNGNHWYIALYKLAKSGYLIEDVKQECHVPRFADDVCAVVKGLMKTGPEDVCIMTTPRRRHKDFHFATEVCKSVASKMNWDIRVDAFAAKDKTRLNPIFQFNATDVQNKTLILFDDIVTTGSTLKECHKHFPKDRRVITIVGVWNHEEYNSENHGT